jgi:hypothetical protein
MIPLISYSSGNSFKYNYPLGLSIIISIQNTDIFGLRLYFREWQRRPLRGYKAFLYFGVQEDRHHELPVPRPKAYLRQSFSHEGSAHSGFTRISGPQNLGHDAAPFPPCAGTVTERGQAAGWGYW